MNYKKEYIITAFLVLFCCLAVIALFGYGRAGRTYLETSSLAHLPDNYVPLMEWNDSGVKGRVLFLFDRRIHAMRDDSIVSVDNYVYKAIRGNVVRKVYHIVPDSSWSEVREKLSGNQYVVSINGNFRMTIEGAPLLVMRMKDIPKAKEKVLVHINGSYWKDDEIKKIVELVKKDVFSSDVITISGNISEQLLQDLSL